MWENKRSGTMLVYHGTLDWRGYNIKRKHVDLSKSKDYLDFGKGFYTTPSFEFAKNTAEYKALKHNSFSTNRPARACVLSFEFDEYLAQFLRCLKFDGITKDWCEFIIANRLQDDSLREGRHHNFDAKYDIVYGDTADGASGVIENIATDIQNGVMTFDEIDVSLIDPLGKINWGSQISFHTPDSLYCICCTECVIL